jgi:hypothetical protein
MGILDYLKESLSAGISDFMKEIEREFSRTILKRVYLIKKQIMKELIAIFIILISLGLLAISAIFFLIEYIHLNKTISFLIIGIIVLIIGIFVKITN